MTARLAHTASAVLAACALAVAGCGDESNEPKIPAATAQDLLAAIEQIEARIDAGVAGACDDIFENVAGGNFDETSQLVDSLPEETDPDIRSALSQSLDRLQQLVSEECDEIQARELEETAPEEPTETVPTETETVPTETETTPTETETTPAPPPSDGDDDPGNGQGNGPDGTGPPGQDDGGGFEVPGGGDG